MEVKCQECGCIFEYEAEDYDVSEEPTCPECGSMDLVSDEIMEWYVCKVCKTTFKIISELAEKKWNKTMKS